MKIIRQKTFSGEYGKLRFQKAMTGMKKGLLAGAAISAIPSYSLLKRSTNNKKMGYAGLATLGAGVLAGGVIGAAKGIRAANNSIKQLTELDPKIKAEIVNLREALWKFDKELNFFNWLKRVDKPLYDINQENPGLFMEMEVFIPEISLSSFSNSPEDLTSMQKEGFIDLGFRYIESSIFKEITATYDPKINKYVISDDYFHSAYANSKKLAECKNLTELKRELIKFLANHPKQITSEKAVKESLERVGSSKEEDWMNENMLDFGLKEFKNIREKLLKRVDQYIKEIISTIERL